MKIIATLSLAILVTLLHSDPAQPSSSGFPEHWWKPVPKAGAPSWEILPQEARPGEVILSKRNELGLLSNFAPTPFEFRGKRYASLEGFWQMMFYPETGDDPRARARQVSYPYTRDQVSRMTAFGAKTAGDIGYENMKKLGIDWVSFEGKRMKYWTKERGEHFELIVQAMRAKLEQNPEVKRVLLSTGELVLRPDHHQPEDAPPSWKYFEIWMELRKELKGTSSPLPKSR